MKGILFNCIFFLTLSCLGQGPVIPAPAVYEISEGTIPIGNQLSFNPKNLPEEIKSFFIKRLVAVYSIQTVVSSGDKIKFKKISNQHLDFYSINIDKNVEIEYSSEASCFYAINTLLQLIEGDKGNYFFTKCHLEDYPKFQWRGLHLDVSRHFFSVDEVKRFIDLMSLYKFNKFHWHLTDDQGWRIEIKKYPKLTEIGAWRDSTVNAHYSTQPRTYTVERYGGFYTQEEIKDIVEYASNRFIEVVPEIEMPGHSRAALAAYPFYSCTMEQMDVPGLWGVFDDIFCAKESSINFVKDILSEVIELFPSQYIHIGGDEAPKSRWNKCPRCQAVIRENGLKDAHDLQSYFIGQIDEYLTSKGRKLIGWDEILEGGLSPNAAVMSWRGFEGGIEAAKQGHYAVMSPGSHCYFDHYQSSNPNEPLAIGGYTPLEKVYEFNPIPPNFNEQQASFILGGQANLWTEYIPEMKQLEYMTYPRSLALSQVLWCSEKPSFEEFKESFEKYHLKYLNRYEVNYSKAFFSPKIEISPKWNGLNIHFKGNGEKYHFDLFTSSDEEHSSMNGGQVVTEKDSLYFERTTGKKIVNYSFSLSSEGLLSSPSIFNLKVHPAIGLPVELITKPNERYKGNLGFSLVDGVLGAKPWKGNEWLGFDTNRIEFIIDLGKKSHINKFILNFLVDNGSWIYPPESLQLSISQNKKKWKKLEKVNYKPINSFEGSKLVIENTFIQELKNKGRYIKVVVNSLDKIPLGLEGEGNKPWTFIDELIIFFE